MKNSFFLIFLFFLLFGGCKSPVEKSGKITPESLGISSQSILNFIEAAEKTRKDDLHSFVLLRHGQVAAQGWWNPYNAESPHMLYSLSKSFTSTAIGIAQSEGLLNINDRVISFFPEQAPKNPSENLNSMRIRDLLKMNTGHNEDATGRMTQSSDWVKGFLSLNVEHKPGTHFVYNSAATFMLSAIIQKVSKQTLLDYLKPRLFDPLGIENPSWETSPDGINSGGWGLRIRTKDIASFGQLYLQKGKWQGKQLIPEDWVNEATKFQTSNGSNPDSDWEQGYGYQFWRCRHNLYRGDGAFGQYCIVFPEQDAVLAINSGTGDMGAIMNLVWDNILPGLKEAPLPENKEVFDALLSKLNSLSLTVVEGETNSPVAEGVSKAVYTLNSNNEGYTSVMIDLEEGKRSLNFFSKDDTVRISFEMGKSVKSDNSSNSFKSPVASSAAWVSPDILQIRSYLFETPYYQTYDLKFNNNQIQINRKTNVGFSADSWELEGEKK